jgi:hypothetical protein
VVKGKQISKGSTDWLLVKLTMGEVRKSLKVALKLMAFDQINVGLVQGHGS